MEGVVLSGANNLFVVLCEDGERRLCAIKGKRIKDATGLYNPSPPGTRSRWPSARANGTPASRAGD
jgi:hypothetical protein